MSEDEFQIYPVYISRFSGSMGGITLRTLLPSFINLLDPSGLMIGLFTAIPNMVRAIMTAPFGWAGDKFNEQNLLVLSLFATGIGYCMFPFVSSNFHFIFARSIQVLGATGVGLMGVSLIGKYFSQAQRARNIGKYNSWRFAAGVIGTLGAGSLFEIWGFGFIFGVLIVLTSFACVMIYLSDNVSLGSSDDKDYSYFNIIKNRRILALSSFRLQFAFSKTLIRVWIPIFAGISVARGGLGMTAFSVGLVLAAGRITNMISQPLTGSFSDEHGRAPFVLVGGFTFGLIGLTIPSAPWLSKMIGFSIELPFLGRLPPASISLAVLNSLLAFTNSIRVPASVALFVDEGEENGISRSVAVRSMLWRPGAAAAPMLGGYLMDKIGLSWVFYIGGLVAISSTLTFLIVLFYFHERTQGEIDRPLLGSD